MKTYIVTFHRSYEVSEELIKHRGHDQHGDMEEAAEDIARSWFEEELDYQGDGDSSDFASATVEEKEQHETRVDMLRPLGENY